MKFDFLVGPIIRFDRFDTFSMFLKDGGSQGSPDFSDKFQFQKDRVEQARSGLMSRQSTHMLTACIVAMQVCQFQKDHVKQVRCGL